MIIIPVADVAENSQLYLEGLLKSMSDFPEPTVVCFDGCKEQFVWHFKDSFNIIPLVNSGKRKNFAGNANLGLRFAYSMGQPGIVVNQDCILPSWDHFKKFTGDGLIVASQVMVCSLPATTEEIEKLNESQFEFPMRMRIKKATGFCLGLSSALMEKVGFFDEYFISTFEDDDICARALLAGFPIEHVDIKVHHYVSKCGSYDANRLGVNLSKFKTKWNIPAEVEHADFNAWIEQNHVWQPEMREV